MLQDSGTDRPNASVSLRPGSARDAYPPETGLESGTNTGAYPALAGHTSRCETAQRQCRSGLQARRTLAPFKSVDDHGWYPPARAGRVETE
jgi:hypothetical protein